MKDLIYFSIGNNKEYCSIWNLCYSSLCKYGLYNGDHLVFLDSSIGKNNINTKNIIEFKCKSILDSAVNKLQIFQIKDISKYDRILYLDCDILVINSIYNILNIVKDNIAVGKQNDNLLMSDSFCGGDLFNNKEKYIIRKNNILGINSGIFAFKPSDENLNILMLAYKKSITSKINPCLEQPSFNYVLFKNKYDLQLSSLIFNNIDCSLYRENISKKDIQKIVNNKTLLHFCGGPGNYDLKYQSMTRLYKGLE